MKRKVLLVFALACLTSHVYAQVPLRPATAAEKVVAQGQIAELLANPPAGFPRPGQPAFRTENLEPYQVFAISQAYDLWKAGKLPKWPEMPASLPTPKGLNLLSNVKMKRVNEFLKHATPRTRSGHPDLSGNWWSYSGANPGFGGEDDVSSAVSSNYEANFPTNTAKYKPELVGKVQDQFWGMMKNDNTVKCGYPGLPRIGAPSHILQGEKELVFLYNDQSGFAWRVIRLGGSFQQDIDSTYYGDSVGRWEGDTLVVESRNFNTETWMGEWGYFHSPQMRIIEKLHRVGDVVYDQITVIDPEVLTEPWVKNPHIMLRTEEQIWEPTQCRPTPSDDQHVDTSVHATRFF